MTKIKKCGILLLTLVFMLISMLCVIPAAFADDSLSWEYDSSTHTLSIIGTGAMNDYAANTLTSIEWYAYRYEIERVVIADGVTHIGSYAFSRENNLKSVIIPDSVTSIGEAAFSGNDSLTELTIPDSVTDISDNAFGFGYDMTLTDGFVCCCGFNSAAQSYCIKNYIMFECPFSETGMDSAHIIKANGQSMWSFVPQSDGRIEFWSTGKNDTYGLIYDACDYVYSDVYNTMKRSAKAADDDSGEKTNFKLVYSVTAGKRYYLSAKFMQGDKYDGSTSSDDGRFDVYMTFTCTNHNYVIASQQPSTCITQGTVRYECAGCGDSYTGLLELGSHCNEIVAFSNDIASVVCSECGESLLIDFMDCYNTPASDSEEAALLDVNSDGFVNAKDYAKLYNTFK